MFAKIGGMTYFFQNDLLSVSEYCFLGMVFSVKVKILSVKVKIFSVEKKCNTRVHFFENGGICEYLCNLYIISPIINRFIVHVE